MRRKQLLTVIMVTLLLPAATNVIAKSSKLSDRDVTNRIIAESIAEYPGVCACPFNRARNGSACGGRSAWSKEGGYSPVCYKDEVTAEMIKEWREQNNME